LTRDLYAQGYSQTALRSLERNGEIVQVRRGAYAEPLHPELDDDASALAHRQLIMATMPLIAQGGCVSHISAAVLHGLPTPPQAGPVHVTRSRQSGQGRRTKNIHVHAAPLPDADVELVDGILTTTVSRTVVDAACMLPLARGVALADAALRLSLTTPEALLRSIATVGRRVGIARARSVLALADPRSESPGESISRIGFMGAGIPLPDLQRELFDNEGKVARVDFIWDEFRLVGEFDGKIKYGRALDPNLPVQEVVYQEKLREDRIRELDLGVTRWTWPDLFSGAYLHRIQRAIDRSR